MIYMTVKNNSKIGILSTNNIITSDIHNEITEKQYNTYLAELDLGKILIEKDGEIVAIDPDELLTPEEKQAFKIHEITWQLEYALAKYEPYTIPRKFNKLTLEQQQALESFLDECDILLKNVTIDTVLPNNPFEAK